MNFYKIYCYWNDDSNLELIFNNCLKMKDFFCYYEIHRQFRTMRDVYLKQYKSSIDEYLDNEFYYDSACYCFVFKQEDVINVINRFYDCGDNLPSIFTIIEYSATNNDQLNFDTKWNYCIPPKHITYLLSYGLNNISDITSRINKLKGVI